MKKLFVLLTVLVLSACSVDASKVSDKTGQDIANNITYIKDHKTGLCFAVVATSKAFEAEDSGLGMAWVPCNRIRK